ncbi:MAG: hypothetical protein ACI82G_002767 [Bradymonadia bacterium]|jgi:hypothetical protein
MLRGPLFNCHTREPPNLLVAASLTYAVYYISPRNPLSAMKIAQLSAFAAAGAVMLLSTGALAQTFPGMPAEGVTVPGRYSNPSQSQELLAPQGATPAAGQQAPNTNGPGVTLEGESVEGDQPWLNTGVDSVTEGSSAGQLPTIIPGSQIYQGITPDHRDTLPHISPYQRLGSDATRANQLSWIGFQPLEEYTRVFVQTGRPSVYRLSSSPDEMTYVIELRDTGFGLTNFARNIDASHFGRAVNTIDAARTGDGNTEVTITLSRSADVELVADGEYLYFDVRE